MRTCARTSLGAALASIGWYSGGAAIMVSFLSAASRLTLSCAQKAIDIVSILLVALLNAWGEDRFPIAALIRQEPVILLNSAGCYFNC